MRYNYQRFIWIRRDHNDCSLFLLASLAMAYDLANGLFILIGRNDDNVFWTFCLFRAPMNDWPLFPRGIELELFLLASYAPPEPARCCYKSITTLIIINWYTDGLIVQMRSYQNMNISVKHFQWRTVRSTHWSPLQNNLWWRKSQ